MPDPTEPRQPDAPADRTGVTIIGARQARDAVARPRPGVQWANDDDDRTAIASRADESAGDTPAVRGQLTLGADFAPEDADASEDSDDVEDGIDGAWMDAGDTTLGDLLGNVSPDQAPAPGRAARFADDFAMGDEADEADDEEEDEADEAIDQDSNDFDEDEDEDEDDEFPASMYHGDPGPGSDTGVIVAAAAATLQRRDRRMAERRVDVEIDEAPAPAASKSTNQQDVDRWGAFAGSGPRWRDDAKDWADVDAADTSVLGDEATQIGTLGGRRSERSDLYSIDESSPAASGPTPISKPGSKLGSGPGSSAAPRDAKVLRFDSLAADTDNVIPVRSGGSAQRTGRRGGVKKPEPTETSSTVGAQSSRPGRARGDATGPEGRSEKPSERRPERRQERPVPPSTITARLGTGALLILAVGLVFTFTGVVGAAVLAAIAIAMAAIELMHALKDRGFRPAIPAVAGGLAGVVAAGMWRGERGVMVAVVLSVAAIASWYLFGAERERPAANLAASFLAFGYPAIGAATAALLLHAPHGLGLLMPAIVCTVAHDVFAYAGGRLIGRTHFTDISPNKTVEGLVIGIIGSVAVSALLFGRLGWHPWSGYPQAIALGLVIGIAAPIGDLFESLLKRDLNIKDMGKLLPGHGGVFDRIDAMLLAVPATWLVALATRHL